MNPVQRDMLGEIDRCIRAADRAVLIVMKGKGLRGAAEAQLLGARGVLLRAEDLIEKMKEKGECGI